MKLLDRIRPLRSVRRPVRDRALIGVIEPVGRVRKEDAFCCNLRRDAAGRLPVGYCSPGCVRRPEHTP